MKLAGSCPENWRQMMAVSAAHVEVPGISIVPARREHALSLGPRLRREDRNELAAACGLPPETALLRAVVCSELCWAALDGKRSIALFGAAAIPGSRAGSPWLLGSGELVGAGRVFARYTAEYLGRMLQRFSRLENWVDARNQVAVRWLARCGFVVGKAEAYGPFHLPFHPFHMGGDVCVLQ